MPSLQEYNSMTLSEAREAVSIYAKRANQRLRSLEQKGLSQASNAYRQVNMFAADNRQFMGTTKHGEIKFNTKTSGRTLQDLKQELSKLNNFLNVSKTSTPTGVNRAYRKSYETFTSRYGNMSYEKYVSLWESDRVQAWKKFSSNEVIRIMYRLNDTGMSKDEILSFVEQIEHDETVGDIDKAIDEWETANGVIHRETHNSDDDLFKFGTIWIR